MDAVLRHVIILSIGTYFEGRLLIMSSMKNKRCLVRFSVCYVINYHSPFCIPDTLKHLYSGAFGFERPLQQSEANDQIWNH